MGRVNLSVAYKMREDGCTFEQIASYFGVTRQYVCQLFITQERKGMRRRRRGSAIYAETPYKGMKKWIESDSRITIPYIAKIMYGTSNKDRSTKVASLIKGRNTIITLEQLNKLLEASGMTYEELFERG